MFLGFVFSEERRLPKSDTFKKITILNKAFLFIRDLIA